MHTKSRFEVLAAIQALYPGVNIIKVSILPTGPTTSLSGWISMLNNCEAGNEPYKPGAQVTFHFEDTTFVHLKF